jgi:hypothetical protein
MAGSDDDLQQAPKLLQVVIGGTVFRCCPTAGPLRAQYDEQYTSRPFADAREARERFMTARRHRRARQLRRVAVAAGDKDATKREYQIRAADAARSQARRDDLARRVAKEYADDKRRRQSEIEQLPPAPTHPEPGRDRALRLLEELRRSDRSQGRESTTESHHSAWSHSAYYRVWRASADNMSLLEQWNAAHARAWRPSAHCRMQGVCTFDGNACWWCRAFRTFIADTARVLFVDWAACFGRDGTTQHVIDDSIAHDWACDEAYSGPKPRWICARGCCTVRGSSRRRQPCNDDVYCDACWEKWLAGKWNREYPFGPDRDTNCVECV